jgi:hypothetical protein
VYRSCTLDGHADNNSTGQTPDDERYVLDLLSEWRSTFIPSLVGSQLPRESIQKLAEILRKGSILYRYDVDSVGGTTAGAIAGPSEEMAYWSFDLLVSTASSAQHHHKDTKLDGGRAKSEVGNLMIPVLIQRFEETLRRFVQDIRLRGRLPLERSVPASFTSRPQADCVGYGKMRFSTSCAS